MPCRVGANDAAGLIILFRGRAVRPLVVCGVVSSVKAVILDSLQEGLLARDLVVPDRLDAGLIKSDALARG